MLNIALINPMLQKDHRILKDTSDGYRTANNFGDTLVPKMLKKALKYSHYWPALFTAYTSAVLKKKNFNVKYCRNIDFDFQKTEAYTKYYFRFNWIYKFTKSFLKKKN